MCKLKKKAFYSLKQASRAWYDKTTEFLTQSGYSLAHADSNLFVKPSEEKLTTILVYMDNLILVGDDEEEIQ